MRVYRCAGVHACLCVYNVHVSVRAFARVRVSVCVRQRACVHACVTMRASVQSNHHAVANQFDLILSYLI